MGVDRGKKEIFVFIIVVVVVNGVSLGKLSCKGHRNKVRNLTLSRECYILFALY